MKKYLRKLDSGFTIIEVIIVLAIAGLIMVIVFLAVPQLQKNSRDQARKSIVSRIKSEIENYASNSGGQYPWNNLSASCSSATQSGTPGDWPDFFGRYLSTVDIKDPSLAAPVITCNPSGSVSATSSYVAAFTSSNMALAQSKGLLNIVTGAKCNGEGVQQSVGANSYALLIGLDRSNTRFCVDNG